VVHVGDDVLLSAEEDKPPYVSPCVDSLVTIAYYPPPPSHARLREIEHTDSQLKLSKTDLFCVHPGCVWSFRYIAQIYAMWEEGKGGGKPKDFFVRASWYFRPKDVPKPVLATALGPKGKASPKELFASAMTEENDVRSVISLAQIGSVPKQASEMADNEYVCRFEYFPLEKRLKPRKASAPSTHPSADSSTGSRSTQVEVSTTAEAVAPAAATSSKSVKKTAASAGPASASSASASASAGEKVIPQTSDLSSTQSSSGSKGKGRSLPSLETPVSPDQSLLASASGEGSGDDGKSSGVAAGDTAGPVLLSPKTGPAKIERSRVGDAYQATVPALVDEKTRKGSARNEPSDSSGEQLMQCVWEPCDDTNDPVHSDAAIRSFLARAQSMHGLQPGDIVRILEGETEDTSPGSSRISGVESGGSTDGVDSSNGSSSSSSSSGGGGGMSRNGSSGSISDGGKPSSSATSSELRLKLPSTPLTLQWGVYLGDADVTPNNATSPPLVLSPPVTTATEDGGASEVPAEASAGAAAGTAEPSASAAEGAAADSAPLAADAAVGAADSAAPVERAVRVVYLNRATSSKSRSIVPLRKVRGRFNEAAALECLRTALMDPEAGLKLWAAQLTREEPPLRTWTAEEVRILNSAVGRFGDDFRDICAFLPGKDQAAVAHLYYTFWGPARSGDAAVQLFRLAESHKPQSAASGTGGDKAGQKRQLTGQDAKESGSGVGDLKRPRPSEPTTKGRGAKAGAADSVASTSAAGASANGSSGGRSGKKQRVVATQRSSEAPWRGGASSSRRSGGSKSATAAAAETNTDSEDETDDEVGRLAASQRFLKAAHGSMPPAQYAQLVELLVRFDSANISMSKLLAEVTRLIHPYPKLEMGFHPFLPPSWNMNGPAAL